MTEGKYTMQVKLETLHQVETLDCTSHRARRRRPWLAWIGLLILVLTLPVSLAQAQDPVAGETLFTQKCASCHRIGGGNLVGPDLLGVTTRRDPAWLARWIKEPDKVLAAGDATATQLFADFNQIPMPNLGLSDSEVAALIAYLARAEPSAAPIPTLPPGNVDQGKALFMGTAALANGGPSCMVCHGVAGMGALGGGALGPDLTDVFNRYGGQDGLGAFLGSPSTTTMNAIWAAQTMTEQERADLVAFFQSTTAPTRPPSTLWTLAALAAAVAAILVLASAVIWRHRLTGVRKPMVAQSTRKS